MKEIDSVKINARLILNLQKGRNSQIRLDSVLGVKQYTKTKVWLSEMAPPRKILRQQLEILIEFIEEHQELAKGTTPAAAPASHQDTRQKWVELAQTLNLVPKGALKTPDGWKKYWFEWRHKCRKKAANVKRFDSGSYSGKNKFIPLSDLEIRVLELSGQGSVAPTTSTSEHLDNFLADSDSESEETLESIKLKVESESMPVRTRTSKKITESKYATESYSEPTTPPPKWAIELEERRIAAEERMADALTSMAAVMRSQEERRMMLEERIADTLTVLAGTMQDLSSGVQEAVQHLRQLHPLQSNGPTDIKDVFI